MENDLAKKWRRRSSLWGVILVIMVYMAFILPAVMSSEKWVKLSFKYSDFLLILLFIVAPIMEVTGIVPLMRQPVSERFMNKKVLVYGMRLFLFLVYASQIFVIYATIMNAYFLS